MILAVSQTFSQSADKALNQVDKKYFIENKGQWDSEVLYLCRMGGLDAWITKSGVNYTGQRKYALLYANPNLRRWIPVRERFVENQRR